MNVKQYLAAGLLILSAGIADLYATNPKGNRNNMEKLTLTKEWDKTFPKSDKVDHSKVTFVNRYGITLAADMYKPKGATGKLPAIAVCGPFGAVKEQAAGLYAQAMAERGFLTIAFDPSFTGESGGTPRYMTSPDINTEDFSAAVDFLVTNPDVDPEKVGIIGICGWGGIAINAAAADPRIKATLASTMYDMSRVNANGYFDADDSVQPAMSVVIALIIAKENEFITLVIDRTFARTRIGAILPLVFGIELRVKYRDFNFVFHRQNSYRCKNSQM